VAALFGGASVLARRSTVTPEGVLKRLGRWITGLGASPIRIEPEAHDRAVAGISHLPHVVAAALAAATTCGRWLMPATARSCASGSIRMGLAPSPVIHRPSRFSTPSGVTVLRRARTEAPPNKAAT